MNRARQWTGPAFDEETRIEVSRMMEEDPALLTDAFYRDLEFGTGGLRGVMGVGTNRMNRYTVGMATQGLANYLLGCFPDEELISVAIAHDCRNNSRYFSEVTAEVLSANGIKVYLFDALRPTPLLSFAVRHFGCQGGIVITASHNPPEYNGYKVYWDDGGQLVAPHDRNVIAEVLKVGNPSNIRFGLKQELIEILNDRFDSYYTDSIRGLSMGLERNQRHSDLRIVFTPIHGSTVSLGPAALKAFGFTSVYGVAEQDVVSGDFPTVKSPNPEEAEALKMALDKGYEVNADLVMGTDPDGDRVGVAIKGPDGRFVLLNGNQTAALITYYLLEQWKGAGKISGKEYIVKTIVTTRLLEKMAAAYGVECYDVLTGFKYIAEIIRNLEGEKTFIAGGEESYGYLVGDLVRDKDAVISCCFVAEAAAWARERGMTAYDLLMEIYNRFGLYHERLLSLTKKGKAGLEEIESMMTAFRETPPTEIAGIAVHCVSDYLKGSVTFLSDGSAKPTGLPVSNVIQFSLSDGSLITMRPSGTEPKIKFYFSSPANLGLYGGYTEAIQAVERRFDQMQSALGLE